MENKKNNSIPVYERNGGDLNNHENGTPFAKLDGYTIYQFSNANSNYFLSIPDEYADTYQLFVGFPEKDLQYVPKKDIVAEIDKIKKMVSAMNKDGIYVLPDIPLEELKEAAKENDNKKFDKLKNNRIQPIISDIYLRIKNFDNAQRTVDQLIYFIKRTESDTKFVQWVEISLPNFVKGITYEQLKRYYYANVNTDEEKNIDYDKTIIIPTEEIYQNVSMGLEKEKAKKRVLTRPDTNNYGFGNLPLIIISLTVLMVIGMIALNILNK